MLKNCSLQQVEAPQICQILIVYSLRWCHATVNTSSLISWRYRTTSILVLIAFLVRLNFSVFFLFSGLKHDIVGFRVTLDAFRCAVSPDLSLSYLDWVELMPRLWFLMKKLKSLIFMSAALVLYFCPLEFLLSLEIDLFLEYLASDGVLFLIFDKFRLFFPLLPFKIL